MAKNNARTFRYSDEVALILEKNGNNFDQLVLKCFYELPEVERQIEEKKKQLQKINDDIRETYEKSRDITALKYQFNLLEKTIQDTDERLKRLKIE